MRPFLAIVKLTCKATLRSYVFHFLFLLLIAVIFILPNTIISDGTPEGFIKISLKYCLSATGFILSLSTIWISCFTLSNDLETYQMHMLASKPVSRITIWFAKFAGVIFLHGTLLFCASIIIYLFILWQFHQSDFTEEQKFRIQNQVLVGRRVYMPEAPDISAELKKEFQKLLNAIKTSAPGAPQQLTKAEQIKFLKETKRRLEAKYGEVPFAQIKYFNYKNLDSKQKSLLSLRYRIYVGKISSKDQRTSQGIWGARLPVYNSEEDYKKGIISGYEFFAKTTQPETFLCGVFHEFKLSPVIIDKNGSATIAFQNFDQETAPLFFQPKDGPKLLEPKTSFLNNYLRAVFMIFLKIILLAGLGSSAGALFSMPVAVFIVISYLIFGISASYVIDIERDFDYDLEELEKYESKAETVARYASHALLMAVIPMQKFETTEAISEGELIEFPFIARFFIEIFALRGLPIFALAAYLYKKREIGLVIKK